MDNWAELMSRVILKIRTFLVANNGDISDLIKMECPYQFVMEFYLLYNEIAWCMTAR